MDGYGGFERHSMRFDDGCGFIVLLCTLAMDGLMGGRTDSLEAISCTCVQCYLLLA